MAKPLFTGPEAMCFPINQVTTTRWDGTQQVGEPYGSEEGRRAGEDVWEMIHEALTTAAEDRRIRALGECVRRFPRETLRHPEVCLYLEHLSRHDNQSALARILADRPRRGRPARSPEEEFTEIAVLAGIVSREGCSAKEAARIARREHPKVFGHKTEDGIANDYSRLREIYCVWSQHRWLPGSKLTDAPWSPPNNERGKR